MSKKKKDSMDVAEISFDHMSAMLRFFFPEAKHHHH